jgi:hypothetical protein
VVFEVYVDEPAAVLLDNIFNDSQQLVIFERVHGSVFLKKSEQSRIDSAKHTDILTQIKADALNIG